jgi:hypothetical protein
VGQHEATLEKISLLETEKFLNPFRQQLPANPLQYRITGAALSPCGKRVKKFLESFVATETDSSPFQPGRYHITTVISKCDLGVLDLGQCF